MSLVTTGLLLISLTGAPSPSPSRKVTLVFGGDVIPHDPVKAVARKHARFSKTGEPLNDFGWGHVFGPLAPVFRAYDFAVVNLETPITTHEEAESKEMIFNAAPALLGGLRSSGVDVATFANNHCLDQHREGITSTREALEAAGLLTAGAGRTEAEAWAPLIIEKNGLRLAIVAVSRWLNKFNNTTDPGAPHVPVVPYVEEPIVGGRTFDEFFAHLKATAKTVDALIVVIHWGAEYRHEPTALDRELARGIFDAGALVVIGHHPHVLQPVTTERLRDGRLGVIAFSLGNLVSNQDFNVADGTKRDGLLLGIELVKPFPGGKVIVTGVTPIGIGTENRTGTARRNVQPVLLDDEVVAVKDRLEGLLARTDGPSRTERAQLQGRLHVLTTRQRRVREMIDDGLPGRVPVEGRGSVPMGVTPVR